MLVIATLALSLTACRGGTPSNVGIPTTTSVPILASSLPAAATPGVASSRDCSVSPDTTYQANGYILAGKRGGVMFIYPAVGRIFTANRPEKFLVFLDPLPSVPPSPLFVYGRNRTSGTETVFENARHLSEYGIEWGTNYLFPDAGCWELRIDEPGGAGMVAIEVTP